MKFQKGDRVRNKNGETGVVSYVDHILVHCCMDNGSVRHESPAQFTHVTESLAELPPVIGERLVYNDKEVVYLAEFKNWNVPHFVQFGNGAVDYFPLAALSRQKRARTVNKVVYYHAGLTKYVTQDLAAPASDFSDGWVKVAEFTHEVHA